MKWLLLALVFLASPARAQYVAPVQSRLNINDGNDVVVKASSGVLICISVIVVGSGAGAVYDTATLGSQAVGNFITGIPGVLGQYCEQFAFLNGLLVRPGTGQILAISYQ